ncbi:MAG: hypothetical protein WDZ74_01630, partial [Candidatus Paceibacterota bacterium]
NNEFVTLSQVTDGGGGGGILNAFVQGGNSFTATAVIGTNDAYNFELETGGTTRLTIFNAADIVAEFTGRVIGVAAVNGDEFVTKAQLDSVVAGASHDPVTLAGTPNYLTLIGQEITLTKLDISDDTNLAAGAGLTLSGNNLAVDGVLEDFDTLGAAASDGQFIVATGVGTFAYESGATARASLGLTIGTDVQGYDAELAAIAGLTSAANQLPYFTGSGTAALTTLTLGGRALINSAGTANTFPYFSASNVVTLGSITAAGLALLDDANVAAQRTTLGGTTVGSNFFTLTNPSAVTFPRINADNTVSALSDSAFRTAIGAGTVTSVTGSGGSTGLTLTGGPITSTGTLTLGGTLAVGNGGTGATSFTSGGILFGA